MQGLMAGSLEKAEQESLTKGWKLILTNQFHDIIPGSSIHEVYEDCHKDYAAIEEIAVQVEEDFTENTALPEENTWTVWNASAWTKDELISIPCTENGYFTDDRGVCFLYRKGKMPCM